MENTTSFSDPAMGSPIEQIIPVITQTVPADRIYLTGRRRRKLTVESIFTIFVNPSVEENILDLVVIVSPEERRTENELQDIIESRCKALSPVNVTILASQKFRQLLESSHPFAFTVAQSAMQLYDNGNITTVPAAPPDKQEMLSLARQDLELCTRAVESFIGGAGYYMQNNNAPMAVFLLHQATEHSLISVIRTLTGYRVHTHNLDKLARYSQNLFDVGDLFPRNTPEETQLFMLLQKAYVDARYKRDYYVSAADAAVLATRVKKLYTLMVDICTKQLNALENNTQ